MERLALSILLITMVISGLTFISDIQFGAAALSSADFNSIITSDTTWVKISNPYTLTGNVLIENGVTLTIEPGTEVNLNSYYIRVNGTLIIQPDVTINMRTKDAGIQVNSVFDARGTSANPIHINGAIGYAASVASASYSSIVFSKSSTSWNEATNTGCVIENVIINSTNIVAENSLKLSNDKIINGSLSFSGGSPIITGNMIETAISFDGASPIISNNNITGAFISLGNNNAGSAIITDNTISNAKTSALGSVVGIQLGYWKHMLIQRNLVTNCLAGIEFATDNPNIKESSLVENNTFINNSIGIWVLNRYTPTIISNNIYNNSLNVRLGDISNNLTDTKIPQYATNDVDLINNYWGTTDQQAINQSIHDFKNDFNLGKVNYMPFLTAPNSEALPNQTLSVPLIEPSSSSGTSESFLSSSNVTIIFILSALIALLIVSITLIRQRRRSFQGL